MPRLITDVERRHRLARAHALAAPVPTPEAATDAVAALHSTDPAAMALAVAARTGATSSAELERALYTDRSLVRLLVMRRTVFAVPTEHAAAYLAATATSVAAAQRRRTLALLVEGGVTDDPGPWLARAEAAAQPFLAQAEVFTTRDLAAADPLLATRMRFGEGVAATEQSVASRLLTLWSCEGAVVRATVAGGWTSSQFRWATPAHWLPEHPAVGDPGVRPSSAEASSLVARRYVARFGPVTLDDVVWWTGWTRTHTRAVVTALVTAGEAEVVAVESGGGQHGEAYVVADDVEGSPECAPWAALLPALDPTAMGWKDRDFVLGGHRAAVFDRNGNAGPTVWVDGRIVGGWAVRDDGTVGIELLEDVGVEHRALLAQRREALEAFLGGAVVKPRARGWTAAERAVRG